MHAKEIFDIYYIPFGVRRKRGTLQMHVYKCKYRKRKTAFLNKNRSMDVLLNLIGITYVHTKLRQHYEHLNPFCQVEHSETFHRRELDVRVRLVASCHMQRYSSYIYDGT